MKITSIILAASVIFALASEATAQSIREKSALLKGDEAKRLAKQCSRESPSDFTSTWEPTLDDIVQMEKRLPQISSLKAKCCIEGQSVENPKQWYLQYAALVWHGENIIYVSAIGREQPKDFTRDPSGRFIEVPSDNWKAFAIIICDGGNSWGVIYHPGTQKFTDLSANGIG